MVLLQVVHELVVEAKANIEARTDQVRHQHAPPTLF